MPDLYTGLRPEFRARLKVFEHELKRLNIGMQLVEGYRDPARQARLYAIGRTLPGKIVTKTKPGASAHQYGLAADYIPVIAGRRTLNVKLAYWLKMGQAAKSANLTWGGWWKMRDYMHLEMPEWRNYP